MATRFISAVKKAFAGIKAKLFGHRADDQATPESDPNAFGRQGRPQGKEPGASLQGSSTEVENDYDELDGKVPDDGELHSKRSGLGS